LVHHMPNKYIRSKTNEVKYLFTTRNQSTAIFQSCTSNNPTPLARGEVYLSGIACNTCLLTGNEVELRTHVGMYINKTIPCDVVAHFTCKLNKSWAHAAFSNFLYRREREVTFALFCAFVIAFCWKCKNFFFCVWPNFTFQEVN